MDIQQQPKILNVNFGLLLKHNFKWQFVRFLIFNYYLIEAVLASSFKQIFVFTVTTLMPMNIIFFIYMGVDMIFKIACIPRLQLNQNQQRNVLKIIMYYLVKKLLILDVIFLVLFILSYVLAFPISRCLRLIILIKLLDVSDFNNRIYQKIHIFPVIRKIYTIFKISYVILLFSHYFGTWFYLIDQVLLQQEYYGNPSDNYQLYYQMNLLAFTPIQELGNFGRYLYGLYFMVSLITTIAYGDIVGKNPTQQVYVSILMVLSTVSLALILQQFMDLVRYDSLGLYDFIKNYNSLKTCMDDNQISYPVQNRVRSYLVYAEYEKKYHAHEDVSVKLTQKLQTDLKMQSYSEGIKLWIVPCLPQLSDHIQDVCNICKLVSFQAQTNIYEQLQAVETASQCGFLYKIQGVVQQYIEFPNGKITMPRTNKRQYNLSKLLLNFNMEIAYDSDDEDEDLIQGQKKQQQINKKRYTLLTVHNRKLKSIKISQFVMIDAQQFYQFINTKKVWFKRIKQVKQKILCEDFPIKMLGQQCSLCTDQLNNHSIENCPQIHLSYNPRVVQFSFIKQFLNKKQDRIKKMRSRIKSVRQRNLNLFQKNIFSMLFKQQNEKKQTQKQIFVNIFKNILGSITEPQKSQKNHDFLVDSTYDTHGLSPQFFLQTR